MDIHDEVLSELEIAEEQNQKIRKQLNEAIGINSEEHLSENYDAEYVKLNKDDPQQLNNTRS